MQSDSIQDRFEAALTIGLGVGKERQLAEEDMSRLLDFVESAIQSFHLAYTLGVRDGDADDTEVVVGPTTQLLFSYRLRPRGYPIEVLAHGCNHVCADRVAVVCAIEEILRDPRTGKLLSDVAYLFRDKDSIEDPP